MSNKNKVKILYDYLSKKDARLNFLTQGKGYGSRSNSSFTYDEKTNEFVYNAWDEHPHNGSEFNEITHRIPVDDSTIFKLTDIAMVHAEEEYDAAIERKRREKKKRAVKNYMNAKLYGKGVAFILEDD